MGTTAMSVLRRQSHAGQSVSSLWVKGWSTPGNETPFTGLEEDGTQVRSVPVIKVVIDILVYRFRNTYIW